MKSVLAVFRHKSATAKGTIGALQPISLITVIVLNLVVVFRSVEAAECTFDVASSYDDGYGVSATSGGLTGDYVAAGYHSSYTAPYMLGAFRFDNVTIPPGTTITSARLRIQAYMTGTGASALTIKGQASDAPDPFNVSPYIGSRPETSAFVAWTVSTPWAEDSIHISPELKTIVQEIVNRPGWSSGNALALLLKNNATSGGYQLIYSYEGAPKWGATAAQLIVEYEGGPPPDGVKSENYIPGATNTPSLVPSYLNNPTMYYPAAGDGICWATANADILAYWDRNAYSGVQYWNLVDNGTAPLLQPSLPTGPGHDEADVKTTVAWLAHEFYGLGRTDEDGMIEEFANQTYGLAFNSTYHGPVSSTADRTTFLGIIQTEIDAGRPISIGSWGTYFGGGHQVPVIGYKEMSNTVNSTVYIHRNTGGTQSEYVNFYTASWGNLDMDQIVPGGTPVDEYESLGDDTSATTGSIDPDDTYEFRQTHNFSSAGDVDWVQFSAVSGRQYTLQTASLGAGCDTVLALYESDGVTQITQDDDGGGEARASRILWNCWSTATYLIRVTDKVAGHGTTANYDLEASYGPADNHAPTDISLSSSSVTENQPSGTVVGNLTATDPDVGDSFTLTLVSGAGSTDNASFTISGDSLRTAEVFDYETKNSYSIRVRATDAGGLWCEEPFTASVTDVDEISPTCTITRDDATPTAASTVHFSVDFSEDVTEFTQLDVDLTGDAPGKSITGFSGGPQNYTVTVGNISGSGSVTIDVDAGKCTDAAGNPNTTGDPTNYTIDQTAPTFSSIAADPSLAKLGTAVTITFTASETLSGNPTVTVNTHAASYQSKTGNDYTYSYTIQSSDADGDATIAISGSDQVGNPGSGSGTTALDVDKTAPAVSSITSTTADGTYGQGAAIDVTLNFTEDVTLVGGNLIVTLETGTTDREVTITPFAITDSISGTYTVQAGDASDDLSLIDVSRSGTTIQDAAGNDADLGIPPGQNLDDNKHIVIQTSHTITANKTGNGTISPEGDVTVEHGGTTNFLMEADPTYHIESIETNSSHIAGSPFVGNNLTSTNYVWANIVADGTITAVFEIDEHSLEIVTAHGTSTPAAGTYTNDYGTVLTNTVSSPDTQGTTQYVCTGWTMTGNEPGSGATTNCAMTHTNDATLTWQWQTQYKLDTVAGANGSVDEPDQWVDSGSNVTVTATASNHYHFAAWSGETNGCTIVGNQITAPMDQPRQIIAGFAIDEHTLQIATAHGTATPAVGTYTNDYGTALTNTVTSPDTQGTTQYVCTGWTMTGNEPGSGATTNCAMTHTNDATLTWQWQTQYKLETVAGANGSVDEPDQWVNAGSNVTISATASNHWHFSHWSGDTNGCSITDNVITVVMDRARSITAHFTCDLDGDGIPDWWEIQYYGGATNAIASTTCSNGVNTVKEAYVAGLDPTDPNARFVLDGYGDKLWWSGVSGRVYEVWWSSNLFSGFHPLETNLPWTPATYTDTVHGVENQGFYKLKVELE